MLTTPQLFEFLKSNNTGPTAAELLEFLRSNTGPTTAERIVDAVKTHAIYVRLAHQAIYLAFPIVAFTAFLPLIFCAPVCCLQSTTRVFSNTKPYRYQYFGMNNIREFQQYPLSLRQFWWVTGLVCIGVVLVLLLVVAVIFCKRRMCRNVYLCYREYKQEQTFT